MSRRWGVALVVALVVLDVLALGAGLRARGGWLPPWQKKDPTFVVTDASASPSAESGTGISAPLLLGMNPAGLVLRATRGACEARFDNPARVWVTHIGDDTAPVEVTPTDIREVLGLMVFAAGTLRLAGLDEHCKAVVLDSTDGGQTWRSGSTDSPGIWQLSGNVQASSVLDPRGDSRPTQCVPDQIVNLPVRRAIISCDNGVFAVLSPHGKPEAHSAGSLSHLSVAAGARPGHFYAFGSTAKCDAVLSDVDTSSPSPTTTCLGESNKLPLAVVTSGDRLLLQLGFDLMVSDDGGHTFDPVGPPAS
jgi:hypothetical protein